MNIAEYNTAILLGQNSSIEYSHNTGVEIGKLFLNNGAPDWTVENTEVINFISDHNIYFKQNTEVEIDNIKNSEFDCLVTLASGNSFYSIPDKIGFQGHHYVVDISPTAIKESNKILDSLFVKYKSEFYQLDFFNIDNVKKFLQNVKGTKGLLILSNCFCYMPTALIYDTEARLDKQNEMLEVLANDKIDWHVDIMSATGKTYRNVSVKQLLNEPMPDDFKVLPWI